MLTRVVLVTALCFSAVTVMACGRPSAATQQVMSAATVDLGCDEASLEIIEDKPMQKRVTGCGRSLTYMNECNPAAGGGQTCMWRPVRTKADQ